MNIILLAIGSLIISACWVLEAIIEDSENPSITIITKK
jgi:hypothetical protein